MTDSDLDLTFSFSFDEDKKPLGFSAEGTASGTRAPAEGDPQTMSGTVKLEAVCASSPELFDLAGCRYRDGEGQTQTISAQKTR